MADHDLQKLDPMLDRLCEEILEEDEAQRLFELLDRSEACRSRYLDTLELHATLWQSGGAESPTTRLFADSERNERQTDESSVVIPPPSTTHHPLPASFVGGPVFSYMVATVVLCLMMLGAWAYKISHDQPNFDKTAQKNRDVIFPAPVFVGRVTGMKDCHWSDPDTQTVVGAAVLFNRQYALASGLLEITYSTGARVILEGPCTYKVDSSAGGFLERGKLTANIRGRNSEHSSLIPHLSYFVVKTPTAIVTDLGTEFGVKVDEKGETTSYVFQGLVKVEIENGATKNLRAGESVLVKTDESQQVRFAHPTHPPKFVRQLTTPPDQRAEEAYIHTVLADRPLVYWPLNEPPGSRWFRDLSGNGFHGASMGTVRAGIAGPFSGQSRAVALNGSGYIDIGRQDRFALSKGFTLEAWVYIDGLEWKENENNNARIFSVGSGEGRYQSTGWTLGYKVKQDSRMPYCVFSRYGVDSDKIDGAEIPSSRWTQLGLVFDGEKTVRLYLDGTERGTKDVGGPVLKGPSWVAIGWGANLGGTYWRGRLAHVAVYAEALNEKCFQNHLLSVQGKQQGRSEH